MFAIAILAIATFVASKEAQKDVKFGSIEAISACELPDGYSPNGRCVSNDANVHFCSNIEGEKNCYQNI